MLNTTRRTVIKGALGGFATLSLPSLAFAANYSGITELVDKFSLLTVEGCNVLAFNSDEGLLLVDSGPTSTTIMDAVSEITNKGVKTLINTHFHSDQTGANVAIGESGARIIAHKKTALHLSTDYYLPSEQRYHRALSKTGQPTQTFYANDSIIHGGEQVDFGHLFEAHTDGDIYVHFRQANILAVGDVVSPERDPSLDWYAGAWLGARVDAMDTLLAFSDDETKIVPAYGPVLTKAHLQAERDLMSYLYERINVMVRDGFSAKLMLEEGLMEGLTRTWNDPYQFLYASYKGMWAHHSKIGDNIL